MNNKEFYRELLNAYKNNDVELFNKLNKEFDLGLESIQQVGQAEYTPIIEIGSQFGIDGYFPYVINYATSRLLVDMDKPITKHKLPSSDSIKIKSYSITIFEILSALESNPNLEEVMNQVEIDIDKDVAINFLFSKGLIQKGDEDDLEEIFDDYSLPQLRRELKSHSLKTSGRKQELIKRLVKFYKSNGNDNVFITEYGKLRLLGVNWVGFYKSCLHFFDFDDFESYMLNNDTGKVIKNAFNYLDEHLKLAYKKKDFIRMHDVFSSQALININEQNFKNALGCELKLYILRANPVFLNSDDLKDYGAILFSNISNIVTLQELTGVDNLDGIFNNCWMDINLDNMLMPKDVALEYLKRAIDSENIEELSSEMARKYYLGE